MGGPRLFRTDQKEVGEPSQTRKRAVFGKFAAVALGTFTFLNGMNINNFGVNTAMAQTTSGPSEAALQRKAEEGVAAFREFMLTGDPTKKQQVLTILQDRSPQFLDRFVAEFRSKFSGTPEGAVVIAIAQKIGVLEFDPILSEISKVQDAIRAGAGGISAIRSQYSDAEFQAIVVPLVNLSGRSDLLTEQPLQAIPRIADRMDVIRLETLTGFARDYGIDLTGAEGRDAIIDRIGGRIKDEFFLTNDRAAVALIKTLLQSYALMEESKRPKFITWLQDMEHSKKADLLMRISAFGVGAMVTPTETSPGVKGYEVKVATGVPVPHVAYETVTQLSNEWDRQRGIRDEQLAAEERKLKGLYPAYIRQTSAMDFAGAFERSPTGQGYDSIEIRIQYLKAERELRVKTRETTRITEIDAELRDIEKWFDGFTINLEGATPNLENKAAAFKKGLWALQQTYWVIRENNFSLIDAMNLVSTNKKMYDLYMAYIFNLDKVTLGIFGGIDPTSSTALTKMRDVIGSMREADVLRGNQAWSTVYYPQGAATIDDAASSRDPRMAEDFRRAATLDSLTYFVFKDYVQAVEDNLVGSPEEKKLVAHTVARLYALSPTLAIKYLRAITNLAEVCRDQRETFELALVKLAAKIDMRASGLDSGVSPTSMLPINTRRIITDLNAAFEEIMELDMSQFSRYDRYHLLDDNVFIDPRPPHAITHRPPAWKYPLTPPYDTALTLGPPYFLPSVMNPLPYVPQFSQGSMFNRYDDASGQVQLPQFNFYDVDGQSRAVGEAFRLFVDEQVGIFGVSSFIPGSQVVKLSPTKLMGELDRAFISREMEPYTFDVSGGGGLLGGRGTQQTPEEDFTGMVGGLGSILTSEGGVSLGGSVDVAEQNQYFAGLTAVAVPVGFVQDIPLVGRAFGAESDQRAGLHHGSAGYQQLSDGTKRALGQALIKAGYPSNPREMGIAVNYEETAEGQSWSNTKYFWVDKRGTIFELEGGHNDFVQMLNYVSVYADQPAFGSGHEQPMTYSANVEPTVGTEDPEMKRGGAVVVWDMGRWAALGHFQAVPLWTSETGQAEGETPPNGPLLLQWTPGIAKTTERPGGADVVSVTMPGELLYIRPDEEHHSDFIIQDLVIRYIRMNDDQTAWEIIAGAGAGVVMKEAPEEEPSTRGIGRGGVLFKWEDRSKRTGWKSGGAGVYYEGAVTDLQTTAAVSSLDSAEEMRQEIESLHRIGLTLYGSHQLANRVIIGALGNYVAEFTSEEYKDSFFRFIGFISGLEEINGRTRGTAVKLDYQRERGLMGRIQQDYTQLGREISQHPDQAERLLSDFREKYEDELMQVFDRYYLGLQVNEDASLQFALISREKGNEWVEQRVDTAYGKFLYDWGSVFVRAYASMPLWAMSGLDARAGVQQHGLIGVGTGFDMFDSMWFQRMAFDVGTIMSYEDTAEGLREWGNYGAYGQAAIRVFSSVLEDSKRFKELRRKIERYQEILLDKQVGEAATGTTATVDFGRIPVEDREQICDLIQETENYERWISPQLLGRIRAGESAELTMEQTDFVQRAMWRWFEDQKFQINQSFGNHVRDMRWYIGGSLYAINEGDEQFRYEWDVATFVQQVDKWGAYAGVAGREEGHTVFAGFDVNLDRQWIIGAIGQYSPDRAYLEDDGTTGTRHEGAGGLSLSYKLPPGFGRLSLLGFARSFNPPVYARPGVIGYESQGPIDVGGFLTWTIGPDGLTPRLVPGGGSAGDPWGTR